MKFKGVLVAFFILLGACGGDAGVNSSGGDVDPEDLPDPCAVVSQAAVDVFFDGSPTGESSDSPGPNGTVSGHTCTWSEGFRSLSISIFVRTSFLTPLGICDYCDTVSLGDESWGGTTSQGAGGSLLATVVGDLGIQAISSGDETGVDDLAVLVAQVMASLP